MPAGNWAIKNVRWGERPGTLVSDSQPAGDVAAPSEAGGGGRCGGVGAGAGACGTGARRSMRRRQPLPPCRYGVPGQGADWPGRGVQRMQRQEAKVCHCSSGCGGSSTVQCRSCILGAESQCRATGSTCCSCCCYCCFCLIRLERERNVRRATSAHHRQLTSAPFVRFLHDAPESPATAQVLAEAVPLDGRQVVAAGEGQWPTRARGPWVVSEVPHADAGRK
jgi:hypothetical protein